MSQHFDLVVEDDPQALLRVVGLFAQRSLVPERLAMERSAAGLRVAIAVAGLDADAADILVARLREGVMVIDASRQGADGQGIGRRAEPVSSAIAETHAPG